MKLAKRTPEYGAAITGQPGPAAVWIWIVPLCLLLGFLAAESEVPVGFLSLIAIPATLLLFLALRHATRGAVAMSANVSLWHWLWLLALAGSLVFRQRAVNEILENALDGWAMFRVVIEVLTTILLLGYLAVRRIHWVGSMARGVIGALTFFGLVCVASTAWSVFPLWTLYKSCEYLIDIALVAAVVETAGSVAAFENFLNWTWALYGTLLAVVWIEAIVWPKEALYQYVFASGVLGARLNGVLPRVSSNDIGTYGAILTMIALCRLLPIAGARHNAAWYAFLFAAGLITVIYSQTRAAIAAILFGAFLAVILSKRRILGAMATTALSLVLVLSATSGLVVEFLTRGQSAEQIESFSSRMDWWSFAIQKLMERPLTGFGAYAGGRFAVMASLGGALSGNSTMHSDYLETIIGTSFWGMVPLLGAITGAWLLSIRFLRHPDSSDQERQLAYESAVILGLLTVRSVFNTVFTWHPPLHFLAVLGYIEYRRRRQLEHCVPISNYSLEAIRTVGD